MKKLILPKKPENGAPCNNCGQCCITALCWIGRKAFGDEQPPPCPALGLVTDKNSEKTLLVCYFVVSEIKEGGHVIQELLGIGKGCKVNELYKKLCGREWKPLMEK